MNKILVSVVIPTYNRYDCLLRAIKSIQDQCLEDIEIIVVNDGSDDPRYYQKLDGVTQINLEKNTEKLLGFKSDGFTRNCGIRVSRGQYIMFLDDDDIFLPKKIQKQLKIMIEGSYEFSCTDALFGFGIYERNTKYEKYNEEHYFAFLSHKMGFGKKFPLIWDSTFLNKHNAVITSTVCVKKTLFLRANRLFREDIAMGGKNPEGIFVDYECWQNLLKHENICYINEPLVYYDSLHGTGQHY